MSYAYRKGSSIFVGYRDDRGRPVRAERPLAVTG